MNSELTSEERLSQLEVSDRPEGEHQRTAGAETSLYHRVCRSIICAEASNKSEQEHLTLLKEPSQRSAALPPGQELKGWQPCI